MIVSYTLEGNRLDGLFPDIASLEESAPAALNSNRDSQVGLLPPFTQVHSNGRAWVATDYSTMMAAISNVAQSIPQPATAAPQPEGTNANVGAGRMYATDDHVHPRLTSATWATLDATGVATITFTQAFDQQPAVILTPLNPTGKPVLCEVLTFTKNAQNKFSGCTIRGSRFQTLPANLTLVTALASFDVTAGSVVGVMVSVTALKLSS